ncbi:MAG: hypothetical protein HQL76_17070 [Magnetococcales bacterium]|nr:hypothetical protein [Magnetococcales bacterium]
MDGFLALQSLREVGLNFSLAGDILRVTPREKLTDETRSLIRAHKNELINMLRAEAPADPGSKPSLPPGRMISERDSGHQTESSLACGGEVFEERAAIIEHEGGIPREWAEELARLCTRPRPENFSPERWARRLATAALFTKRWAAKAVHYGWTAAEFFGDTERPGLIFGF